MTGSAADRAFEQWLAALDERHLADLTRTEVARALRALSSCYVERRAKLAAGGALDSAGKRAAFALFYGPVHFLVTRHIVRAVGLGTSHLKQIVDVGCGTGAAGAAWALEAGGRSLPPEGGSHEDGRSEGGSHEDGRSGRGSHADGRSEGGSHEDGKRANIIRVVGIDRHPWAIAEANWTYRQLGIHGRATQGDAGRVSFGTPRETGVIAAYTVNELPEETRERLLAQVIAAHTRGARVLIVEPIARRIGGWWNTWESAFRETGGRTDEWRFPADLPPRQCELARAAGLNPRELTARTLLLA